MVEIFIGNLNYELAIKKFNKKVANSSIFKEIKLRNWAKPSERKKVKALVAHKRRMAHLKRQEKHSIR